MPYVFLLAAGLAVGTFAGAEAFIATHHPGAAHVSQQPTTTILYVDPNATTTTTGGYTVRRIDAPAAPRMPSLTGATVIGSTISPDVAAAVRTRIAALETELKQNPNQLGAWLELGIERKIGGDYAGAAEDWVYVSRLQSSVQYVAFGNLGDLYMNFLINYPLAEANYKQAIALNSHVVQYYEDLYTLYTSFYKQGTGAAADIVAQGLKNNPGNPDLLKLQGGVQ